MSDVTQAPVLFTELPCGSSGASLSIGLATLNLPKALNSLNLAMVRLLLEQLNQWQTREDIVAVVLRGAGEKAFCAGGDVVALHNAMQASPKTTPAAARDFFTEEYKLDHLIHDFAKPIIVWGSGIVMGGGMGLLMGASHRIVTETSRFAMPEITIGLYPDVGGSYFLNKMPAGCGLFCGLTGVSINAADALALGLSDHYLASTQFDELLSAMQALPWQKQAAGSGSSAAHSLVSECCSQLQDKHETALPDAQFARHEQLMSTVAASDNVGDAVQIILQAPSQGNKWLGKAQANLHAGSPITMHLVFQQLTRAKSLSFAECLQMELAMSFRCAAVGEFQEGVRALLIDKDMQPKWQYSTYADVPKDLIESFFQPQWQGSHPLAELNK